MNFNWRKDWVTYFESPWSIIEKLKYANSISSYDVLSFFIKNEADKESKPRRYHQNLIDLDGLDDKKIEYYLSFSLNKHNQKYIDILTNKFFDKKFKGHYLRSLLYHCPVCILYGHHSIFFQFKFIKKCPYHLKNLTNGCPKCGHEMDYLISLDNRNRGYMCVCGSMLKDYQPYSNDWFNPNKLDIKDKTISRWVSLDNDNCENTDNYIFLTGDKYFIKQEINNYPNILLDLLLLDYYPELAKSKNLTKIRSDIFLSKYKNSGIDKEPINPYYPNNITGLYKLLYNLYLNYIKYLNDKISNKLQNVHYECLDYSHKNKIYCPFVSAYLEWKKEIPTTYPGFINFISDHLDVISFFLKENSLKNNQQINQFIFLFKHIIIFKLISKYKTFVQHFIKECQSNNSEFQISNFSSDSIIYTLPATTNEMNIIKSKSITLDNLLNLKNLCNI
jgi:hypothetical protein